MKQLTQSEIRKNGKVYKNVSSPETSGTMKQVTDIVEKDGTFSISTDGGKTYSPAGGAVPEALPQEASALKSGSLPRSGWGQVAAPFWEGELYVGTSLTEVAPAGTVPEALRQDTSLSNWSVKYAAAGWVQPYSTPSIEGANLKIPYSGTQNMYVYPDGSIYAQSVGSTYTYYGIKNKTYGKQTYTISDTTIIANSDILMELTDDGGVKAYSMEAGKMTVIRDTVPTQPIPYTYKVKQTNASGQFTLVNHFVPNVPDSPTSLPVTYKKASGSLPTSGWNTNTPFFEGELNLPYGESSAIKICDGDYRAVKVDLTVTAKATTGYETGENISTVTKTKTSGSASELVPFSFSSSRSNNAHFQFKEDGIYVSLYTSPYTTYTCNLTLLKVQAPQVGGIPFYTISDTDITENTAVKMYLTDEGGVKAYSKANGKITVIRDSVPTTAIPYEYEVEQTSAEGLFEVINAYVPDVPTKTSELTNDSGFLTKNNIVAGDNVTVTDENGNVKISTTGGGSGGVTYTKLVGSVNFTVTTYTDDPFFLEQDAATWSENPAIGNKALTSTTDIGLIIGNSYTMVVNIQGTSTMFTAKAEDGNTYGLQGSKVLWFRRENISSDFIIYDHCNIANDNIQAGNGCIFVANLSSDITIANINYFSGNRGVITPVTITNSAIKINSAVTMYINSSLVVSGTKTDGSITLTASTEGSVSYEMEILDTPTEGLFEVINGYVPTIPVTSVNGETGDVTIAVPTKTSELTNDSGFITGAGEWSASVTTATLSSGRYEILYGGSTTENEGAIYIIDFVGTSSSTVYCQSWSVCSVVDGNLNIYTYRIKITAEHVLTVSQTISQVKNGGTITDGTAENQSFKYRKIN